MLYFLNVGTVPMLYFLNVGTVPMLYFLNVGTVPMLYFLNVGTVPTSSHSPYFIDFWLLGRDIAIFLLLNYCQKS